MAEEILLTDQNESTVIVDAYRNVPATPLTEANSYKGLSIHALSGLHRFAGIKAGEYIKPGGTVLDLASGSGAMSQRLVDLGFQVSATDYVGEAFQLHDSVPFFTSNLNERFSGNYRSQFDGVMALEIIEHLENPRNFARECFKLLVPGGKLIFSTPNVDCPLSIASFIRSRTFQWFGDSEYKIDGHITPLTQWQLIKCFQEAGFSSSWVGSFGDFRRGLVGSPRLRILTEIVRRLSTQPPELSGEIFVAVFERPPARSP